MRTKPSFQELTALFLGAVAAGTVVTQAAGCGPCRAAYVEYEKLVPLEDDMTPSADTLSERCTTLCDDQSNDLLISCEDVNVEGEDTLVCVYSIYADCGGIGRVPTGLAAMHAPKKEVSSLGRYFARVAHLEAASVHAFRELERDLRRYDAPAHLVRRARDAAGDEAHHAAMMAALARRFGARPQRVQVTPPAARSLEAIALENAVEGCVRETFGAAVAHWQAQHAATEELREVMRTVARDETRHAALAFAVHAWAVSVLGAERAARVEERARGVARACHLDGSHVPDPAVARVAGFPPADVQRKIAEHMGHGLWGIAA